MPGGPYISKWGIGPGRSRPSVLVTLLRREVVDARGAVLLDPELRAARGFYFAAAAWDWRLFNLARFLLRVRGGEIPSARCNIGLLTASASTNMVRRAGRSGFGVQI